MGSETYHEPLELLSEETKEMHRALTSLVEELEAIDWYQQRAEACSDDRLRDILTHNRNEEMEHAAMALEWIRRMSPAFEERLRRYLFSSGDIVAEEEKPEATPSSSLGNSLGIGSLREKKNGSAEA